MIVCDSHKVIEIESFEQSQQLGKNRGWCTSNRESDYNSMYSKSRGSLYMIYKHGMKRPQAQLFIHKNGSFEFKLKFNGYCNLQNFINEDEELKKWVNSLIKLREYRKAVDFTELDPRYSIRRRQRFHNDNIRLRPISCYYNKNSNENLPYSNIGMMDKDSLEIESVMAVRLTIETETPGYVHNSDELTAILHEEHYMFNSNPFSARELQELFYCELDNILYILLDEMTPFEIVYLDYSNDNSSICFIVREDDDIEKILTVLKYYKLTSGDFERVVQYVSYGELCDRGVYSRR